MRTISYITTNSYKFTLAESYFAKHRVKNVNLLQGGFETPEIQASTSQEVAVYSAEWARDKLGQSVICSDVSFKINALTGFPGPYIKYINQWLSPNDILNLLKNKTDRSASFIDTLAYAAPGEKTQIFTMETPGTIPSSEYLENTEWTIDAVFMPEGFDKTLVNMSEKERDCVWDDAAWTELVSYINKTG
ncbi:MAG: non-canonical purine NTP pyrophosphatase [Candidatus Saccharibacteria bacterium]